MKRIRPLHLAALILLFGLPRVCSAHDIHLTGIKIIWDDSSLMVSVLTPASRLGTTDYDAAVRRRLKLRLDGREFNPGKATLMLDQSNDMLMWQALHGGHVSRIEALSDFYPEDPASRLLVTIFRGGAVVQEAVLDRQHPTFVIGEHHPDSALFTVAGRFVREGVFHIFNGIDHICFVLGLLLLGGSLRQLLKTITAFTVAHSITLSLAATGIYTPSPRVVEPLIALSIVAIALENLRVRHAGEREKATDWRPLIAFGFGLIHGFGFAGALAEVGIPREVLGWALVSFNIGVELGQGAIVLAAAPLLAYLARRSSDLHRCVVVYGSCIIAAAGAFWFVQRLSGR